MTSSSSRVKTLPVGLFGVLMMMARVRFENARARSSGSNRQSGAWSRTKRGVAPETIASGP
jgi:hypothetical protein